MTTTSKTPLKARKVILSYENNKGINTSTMRRSYFTRRYYFTRLVHPHIQPVNSDTTGNISP